MNNNIVQPKTDKSKNERGNQGKKNGASCRSRTDDLLITSQLL